MQTGTAGPAEVIYTHAEREREGEMVCWSGREGIKGLSLARMCLRIRSCPVAAMVSIDESAPLVSSMIRPSTPLHTHTHTHALTPTPPLSPPQTQTQTPLTVL